MSNVFSCRIYRASFIIHIVYPQLNVPLLNSANIGKSPVVLPFLDNVRDIPNFPVLWIDLGADVESVRRQKDDEHQKMCRTRALWRS